MVAKINTGSSLYGALIYNFNKVQEGTARIISDNRIIASHQNGSNHLNNTILSFESYLTNNENTEKPILHISLNPAPEDKLTDEQFAELAKDYMDKMGYCDQPYVVYMHEDTGRRHIHIVSTCVDENGKKINDAYTKRRSMDICRELEQKYGLKNITDKSEEMTKAYLQKADYKKGDVKRQVSNILKSVFTSYKFQSFGEYNAMLSCFNIEAKKVDGEYEGAPYKGIVYTMTDDKGKAVGPPMKSSLFGKQFGFEAINKRIKHNTAEYKKGSWTPNIQAQVAMAMADCGGRQKKFKNLLAAQGVDVVIRKNDSNRIYGITFIDHKNREVYNGSRLGKEFSANAFEELFNGQGKSVVTQTSENDFSHSQYEDRITAIYDAFGIFDIRPNGPDYEEEEFARRMQRKKKKKKKGLKL